MLSFAVSAHMKKVIIFCFVNVIRHGNAVTHFGIVLRLYSS